MTPFLKTNKSLITYSLIFLIVIPIFGFNFVISILGNILLLILLVPVLLLLIALISFNSIKSKVKVCNQCGTASFGISNTCINCGADLSHINEKNFDDSKKPGESTIEVKAEEID